MRFHKCHSHPSRVWGWINYHLVLFIGLSLCPQTVLRSLHLPKNNSLYVLTPDIAPTASTSQNRYVPNLTPLLFPVLSHIIFSKQFPAGNWHCLPNTLQYLNMQLHWLLHWLLPTSKRLVNQQDCTTLPTKPFSYGLNTRWHCTPSNLKNSLWNICHEYCTIASNLNIYKDIWPLCTEVILTFEVKSYWNILCIM